MSKLVDCYLGLGSNLGNREQYLDLAVGLISQSVGEICARSPVYESPPWGLYEAETYVYLNAAVLCQTRLAALEVLQEIRRIETELGRTRTVKNAPRTIDIDILFYGNHIIRLDELTVPHPYIQERNFVLLPMLDLDPGLIHPVFGISLQEIYQQSQDQGHVQRYR